LGSLALVYVAASSQPAVIELEAKAGEFQQQPGGTKNPEIASDRSLIPAQWSCPRRKGREWMLCCCRCALVTWLRVNVCNVLLQIFLS